ncbi:MAG: hypothetical protein OQL27_10965 [Sedimenticola sp.]|nr:hypothetical protein [Sedimenticola sp.]
MSDEINTKPNHQNFSICFDTGCNTITQLSLQPDQWQTVLGIFKPAATNASEERIKIGQAIAQLEKYIGEMTGTHHDKGRNKLPDEPVGHPMDCIDESTNTTTYLYMIQQAGVLKWHQLKDPVTRGFFFFGWPHTTAVIQQQDNRTEWAVDSWFHDNGVTPEIVPLPQWESGWNPAAQ